MDPREFVETRTKRYMAQALEEFEYRIEQPLQELLATGAPIPESTLAEIFGEIERVKRTFRKKLLMLGSDCLDLIPSDVQINALELVRRTV